MDIERVKATCLTQGVRVSKTAVDLLSEGGNRPLTLHEYATTGGVTFVLPGDVYVNAPFDDWYCDELAMARLDVDGDRFMLVLPGDDAVDVERVLPLPSYTDNEAVTCVCMSHADRARVSPILGCAYDCQFCDLPLIQQPPLERSADQLLEALATAAVDPLLPARHILISGGTPRAARNDYFRDVCVKVIEGTQLPVDVMMAATDDPATIDRMVEAGVHGFSINIELFGEVGSKAFIKRKYRSSRPHFEAFITRAVDHLGNTGRVRSLILLGLEDRTDTIAGIEYLASLGVSPVLSPFRPARGTPLENERPPTVDFVLALLDEAREIAKRHGVSLGPSCVPCQNNTLTFPWDVRPGDQPVASDAPRREEAFGAVGR